MAPNDVKEVGVFLLMDNTSEGLITSNFAKTYRV